MDKVMQIIVVLVISLIVLAIFAGIKYFAGGLGYDDCISVLVVVGIFSCARGLYQVRLSNENIRRELEQMRLDRDKRRQDEAGENK